MALVLTNSLSKKKEPFVPLHSPRVKMYVCGPTVYNYFIVDIGEIHDSFHLITYVFKIAFHHIVKNKNSGVTNVNKIINGTAEKRFVITVAPQ